MSDSEPESVAEVESAKRRKLNQSSPRIEPRHTGGAMSFLNNTDQTGPDILEYIEGLKYGTILIGECSMTETTHGKLRQTGLLSDSELALFRHVNKILQYPACVQDCEKIASDTQRIYSYAIARYLRYAARKNRTPENLTVDGILMLECMEDYVQTKAQEGETSKLKYKATITSFKRGMGILQFCIGIYSTRDIDDLHVRVKELEKWKTIPHLEYLDAFAKQRSQFCRSDALEKFNNKVIHDTYSVDDLRMMMIKMYALTGTEKQHNIYNGITAVLNLLMDHHLLFRGKDKILAEVSDVGLFEHETSRGKIPILGFNRTKGASTSSNKPDMVGCCRNKDVEICLVTAFAMSLWYRFDFDEEGGPLCGDKIPDFFDKSSWYPVKVIFAKSHNSLKNKAVSTQYLNMMSNMAFESIGYKSSKKSYISQNNRARKENAHLFQKKQTQDADHFQVDSSNSHPNGYRYDFILSSGGFKEDESYSCTREIEPPKPLQKKIFPWLDAVIEEYEKRQMESGDWEHHNRKDVTGDGALPKFIHMMTCFRKIVLQDLVELSEKVPSCIFAQHPITKDPDYIQFEVRMKELRETCIGDPYTSLITQVEDIESGMNSGLNSLSKSVDEFTKKVCDPVHFEILQRRLLSNLEVKDLQGFIKKNRRDVQSQFSSIEKQLKEAMQMMNNIFEMMASTNPAASEKNSIL